MSEDNKKDILEQIEDKIVDKREDYKTELLDEDNGKRSYIPIMIIILILAIGLVIALGVNSKTGFLTGKYANIEVNGINNINIIQANENSKVDAKSGNKKIHVDIKDLENPGGMVTFDVNFINKGKIAGKAYKFRVENKSGSDEIVVRNINDMVIQEVKENETATLNITVAVDGKYNNEENVGKKYNSSFDIVYDTVEIVKEK